MAIKPATGCTTTTASKLVIIDENILLNNASRKDSVKEPTSRGVQTKYSSREDENRSPPDISHYNGAVKDNILGNILDAAHRMCKRAKTAQGCGIAGDTVAVGIAFILSASNGVTQGSLNRIFFDIYKANKGKNLAVSPLPFRLALCRLAAIASGETKQEIKSALGIKMDSDIKTCFSSVSVVLTKVMESDMTLLNKIYINYTNDVDDTFIIDSRNFGVTVTKIGFNYNQAAAEFVNREFDSKTLKRIQGILETRDIGLNSSLLLVNGVHVRVSWENRFDLEDTKTRPFHGVNKTSNVMMMNRIQLCLYLDDSNEMFKAISFHLTSYGTSIMFLIPYAVSSFNRIVTILTDDPNLLSNIRKRMSWKNVNVFLPRFKIRTGSDWTQYLRESGLNLTTSSNNTGMNSILKNKNASNIYVSKAIQKVFIQVDEMGIFRPVREKYGMNAREVTVLPDEAYDKIPQFMGNRPFLFFLGMSTKPQFRDSPVIELVSGIYNGPEE